MTAYDLCEPYSVKCGIYFFPLNRVSPIIKLVKTHKAKKKKKTHKALRLATDIQKTLKCWLLFTYSGTHTIGREMK